MAGKSYPPIQLTGPVVRQVMLTEGKPRDPDLMVDGQGYELFGYGSEFRPPGIRRWCETCQRYTRSQMGGFYGDLEICAEHEEECDDD